ncbi:MAG: hypothetical protein KDE54_10580, partial [Caldilineaceae bacterium]|nr:hypothetical protein [Caldilineaceae bacterium]
FSGWCAYCIGEKSIELQARIGNAGMGKSSSAKAAAKAMIARTCASVTVENISFSTSMLQMPICCNYSAVP